MITELSLLLVVYFIFLCLLFIFVVVHLIRVAKTKYILLLFFFHEKTIYTHIHGIIVISTIIFFDLHCCHMDIYQGIFFRVFRSICVTEATLKLFSYFVLAKKKKKNGIKRVISSTMLI